MSNALTNWVNDHKEEIKAEQEKAEAQGKKVMKLAEGETVIELAKISEVSESEFVFNEGNDNEQKVKRYFYHRGEYVEEDENTHAYLVPKSVHMAIVENVQEYRENLIAVKIKKTGTGKSTEYNVFPQLKK